MSDPQRTIEDYADELRSRRTETGLASAQRGDPDLFAEIIDAIRRVARARATFTADDVRARTGSGGAAMGAAFQHLARAGEIRPVGYATSTAASRHGAVVRLWAVGSPDA